MSDKCVEHCVIYDSHTGDDICCNCGTIVGVNYESLNHSDHNNNTQWRPTRYDFLINACSNHNVAFCIIDDACNFLKLYLSEHKKLPISLLSAKAIYASCFKHQVPRSITEIAHICDIREQDLSSICEGVCELLPSDLVERICQKLSISFKLSQEIKHQADIFFKGPLDSSPQKSSVALAIVCISNKYNLQLELKRIAQASHLSLACLRRLCFKYQKYIPSHTSIAEPDETFSS